MARYHYDPDYHLSPHLDRIDALDVICGHVEYDIDLYRCADDCTRPHVIAGFDNQPDDSPGFDSKPDDSPGTGSTNDA